jgi:thiol-disulfide isomerase/thioredoxin
MLTAAGMLLANIATAQSAIDLDGHAINPLAVASGKVVVLVFLRRDCPVSGRYAPTIQEISREYTDTVNFWLVDPDKTDSPSAIRKYLEDYGYKLPALRDPEHALAKFAHVQITPEVAVLDRNRNLVYAGRIDDWFIELGRTRPAPTTHELKDAIEVALSGKTVTKSEVRGVGCYLSDLE